MYINKLAAVPFHDLSSYGYPVFILDKKYEKEFVIS